MPLLTRNKGESQDDFIARCMDSETMKREFPKNKQRLAVCYSIIRKGKKR